MRKKIRKKLICRFFLIFVSFFLLASGITTFIFTYGEYVSKTERESSGIKGSTVYINESEADYYYYLGLNYTYDSEGRLPSGVNQNLYNENTLVEVKIEYSSKDINNSKIGYVSLSELQDTFVYYKTYPINDNGTNDKSDDYILIELIDNPFTNRPNDMGFNGWVTDYSGVILSYENDYYTRYAKVPVSYNNDIPNVIDITFNASWAYANVGYINNNSNWNSAFANLEDKSMVKLEVIKYIYAPYDMSGYFYQEEISFARSCSGLYDSNGEYQNNCTCWSFGGCTYYSIIENENYIEGNTYYYLNNNMSVLDPDTLNFEIDEIISLPGYDENTIMAGYYRLVELSYGDSLLGFYDSSGNILSGTCNNYSGCNYYELIQYYNDDGSVELMNDFDDYYYFSTRDLNLIVMNSNVSNTWGSSNNKPFTLTGIYNGINYNPTWNVSSVAVEIYNDTTIENMIISTNQRITGISNPSYSSSRRNLIANSHNLKIGRGISQSNNYSNFVSIVGGSNSSVGSSSNIAHYKIIIESGVYNSISLGNGASTSSRYNLYVEIKAIYGNDYDKVLSNNSNLDIYYCASGSWSGNYYASTAIDVSFDLIVKSGSFGSSKYDNTTGIYVGGRYGGTHYAARKIKVEGGWIYNLIGGPLTASNRGEYNDTYIFITGGEVDMITGGAGQTATYGNRIIQVTGGRINYSVFGGSNGYDGTEGDGTVNGSSFIYIGGNSVIGNDSYVNNGNTLYSSEAGSVFGIGNGRSGYSTIGSSDNSYIIIADYATIKNSVYGGGNFGATGISSNYNNTTSKINIYGGTINGNVYGGGNKNGSGSTSKNSFIEIYMTDGVVNGNIYGGSNETGTIYGNVDINIFGGSVLGNVYGGGKGGTSSSSQGTFVSKDINVVIGNNNSGPTVSRVYGGSAYGTVNGTVNNNNVSSYNTSVVINGGTISDSVYGGGEGNETFVPYVLGNVSVIVNAGNIQNLYGGNDASGLPNGDINVTINGGFVLNAYGGGNLSDVVNSSVYLNGGEATNIYGGGNLASIDTSNIYLNSGIANNVYGGCNNADANITNITLQGSTINNIYGGSNESGIVTQSNILTNSGVCQNIYGGGKLADTTNTVINLYGGNITDVYGGGEKSNVLEKTTIVLQGANITKNIYGGSNLEGNVPYSFINALSGNVDTIFGGNNEGGVTNTTEIVVNGANISYVYGGGRFASVDNTNINLIRSNILAVYGGGENADVNGLSKISLEGSVVQSIFGGSNKDGTVAASNITLTKGVVDYVYGGNNLGGVTNNSNIELDGAKINSSIFGGGNQAFTETTKVSVLSNEGVVPFLFGGGNSADVTNSSVYLNGGSINNVFGGSNTSGTVISSYIEVLSGNYDYIYGSNNQGGITITTNLDVKGGNINYIYGGGNFGDAESTHVNIVNSTVNKEVYGGGNQAAIEKSTDLNIINSNIIENVYGGGNLGIVGENTDIYLSSSTVLGSVYAGGNGITAVVEGNTILNIDGTSEISNHVFGGGNAAATGTSDNNNSNSVINIAGATIGRNVYGGANTSVLYGTALVNIGRNYVTNTDLVPGNIIIGGTVFGGGEANASGDENYDYSFISVTVGININIDADGHDLFKIGGSIFGSGNASSTTGYSYITIKNYGSENDYKNNISIQRASRVILDNSWIELSGATDRTNEYSTTLFTLSRIDELQLINSSVLYLQTGANLLKKFSSLAYDDDGQIVKANVSISDDGKITKNVNNQVYMYEGKNLNVATTENVTSYGVVNGMTFFGMYNHDRDGKAYSALYNPNYTSESILQSSDIYYFNNGSYVLGLHNYNHNYKIDGFYSNFADENNNNRIKVDYIVPTPEDSSYYMWVIGETVASYEISLTASKYSTLGTVELPLINFSTVNTTFSIVGFNYNNLNSGISLIEDAYIPRVAENAEDADNIMSLVMKTSNSGWITRGKTSFLTNDTYYSGTIDYIAENSSTVPSLFFYLYHSKNLSTAGDMGSVTISLIAVTPIDDLNNDVQRININVNLSRALYSTNEYEGTITAGREYEMFASSVANITSKSSFSTYYSLYAESEDDFYKEGYHRVLTSTYNFPKNTKITMIDFLKDGTIDYYYYVVTDEDNKLLEEEFNSYGEVSYEISKFIKMGSPNEENNYNDEYYNNIYYDSNTKIAEEEFIFIVDFSESNITEDKINETLLLELRDSENQTLVSVIGVQQDAMKYNLYVDKDAVINVNATLDKNTIYIGDTVNLNVVTDFFQSTINSNNIYDTNYFDHKLGIKITILDENSNVVNGSSLMGISFTLNGVTYYPRFDGSIRINIAERVANVSSNIVINTVGSNLASGNYTLLIESFGSSDGIYYGLQASSSTTLDFSVINTIYGLDVDIDEKQLIIDKETGYTKNDNNVLVFNVEYESGLKNPNLRIALYRRDYEEIYTDKYNLVDLKDYITNDMKVTSDENIYLLTDSPTNSMSYYIYMLDNLISGTYKIVFSIYDNDTYIGDVERYLIIK